jgi:hypothetical protein
MWRVAGPCDSMYVCSMRVSFIISLLKSNLKPSHESCAVPVRALPLVRAFTPVPPGPAPAPAWYLKMLKACTDSVKAVPTAFHAALSGNVLWHR